MGFSQQEYWSRLPFPSPEDLPHLGIKPTSLGLAGGFFTTSTIWEAQALCTNISPFLLFMGKGNSQCSEPEVEILPFPTLTYP